MVKNIDETINGLTELRIKYKDDNYKWYSKRPGLDKEFKSLIAQLEGYKYFPLITSLEIFRDEMLQATNRGTEKYLKTIGNDKMIAEWIKKNTGEGRKT